MAKLRKVSVYYSVKWVAASVKVQKDGWIIELINRSSFPTVLSITGMHFRGSWDHYTDSSHAPLEVRLISDSLANPGDSVHLSVQLGATEGVHFWTRGGVMDLVVPGDHRSTTPSNHVYIEVPPLAGL